MNSPPSPARNAVRRLRLESLETRRLLAVLTDAGLSLEATREQIADQFSSATIITHGFQLDGGGDSLMPLAEAIVERNGGLLVDFDVDDDGGLATFDIFESVARAGSDLVLLFDWGDASNNDSAGWGEAAGDALFSIGVGLGIFDPSVGAASSIDLHFIGHSFGTAVTSEAVERLAAFEIPVGHLTYLDPHDFDQSRLPIDGSQDLDTLGVPQIPASTGYGATVWNNVEFADAYYQTNPLGFFSSNPGGRPIPGAHNVSLTAATADASFPHSAVWNDFYVSTITDLNATNGYAWSSRGGESDNRPAPVFFGGNEGEGQDHEHTPLGIANRSTGAADTVGLAAAGLTPDQITLGRWNPVWTPSLNNGAFTFTGNRGSEVPGWSFHGGGGNAEITSGGNTSVQFENRNERRTHNWTYLPTDIALIDYELSFPASSTGATLEFLIGEKLVESLALNQLSASERSAAASTGLVRRVPVSPFAGSVDTFTFRIADSSTGSVDVSLDDIEFVFDTGIPLDPAVVIPESFAAQHTIPSAGTGTDGTAILFEAVTETTVSVTPLDTTSITQDVFIVDRDLNPVGNWVGGTVTAMLTPGEVYALVARSLAEDRVISVQSSAGEAAINRFARTNLFHPTDTNASGLTSEVDALRIINELNRRTGNEDETDDNNDPNRTPTPFLDVNNDRFITALDALLVINYLNARGNVSSEPLPHWRSGTRQEFRTHSPLLEPSLSSFARRFQVLDTLTCERFSTGGIVEHLDTDPPVVLHIAEGLHDRLKLHVAHPRTEQVRVVGVKVDHAIGVTTDDLVDRFALGTHCLDVEM